MQQAILVLLAVQEQQVQLAELDQREIQAQQAQPVVKAQPGTPVQLEDRGRLEARVLPVVKAQPEVQDQQGP